jgi:hypothetical protein
MRIVTRGKCKVASDSIIHITSSSFTTAKTAMSCLVTSIRSLAGLIVALHLRLPSACLRNHHRNFSLHFIPGSSLTTAHHATTTNIASVTYTFTSEHTECRLREVMHYMRRVYCYHDLIYSPPRGSCVFQDDSSGLHPTPGGIRHQCLTRCVYPHGVVLQVH